MCAVRIKKAAAIRAPIFNELLRRNGALRNRLSVDGLLFLNRSAIRISNDIACAIFFIDFDYLLLNQLGCVVRAETLRYAAGDEYQRTYKAEWQTNPKCRARQVHPELADGVHLAPRDTANESDGQCA